MDNELIDLIVRLKCESKILRGLVDTILDNTRLSYSEDTLRIENEDPIITVLKAFFGDEVNNRLKELKEEREAIHKKAAEEIEEESYNG